jgi:hypothetical protein
MMNDVYGVKIGRTNLALMARGSVAGSTIYFRLVRSRRVKHAIDSNCLGQGWHDTSAIGPYGTIAAAVLLGLAAARWHFVSDIAAGAFVGSIAGAVTLALWRRRPVFSA